MANRSWETDYNSDEWDTLDEFQDLIEKVNAKRSKREDPGPAFSRTPKNWAWKKMRKVPAGKVTTYKERLENE